MATTPKVRFDKKDEQCEIHLANFLATLTKQGVIFTIAQDNFEYEVTLTGGF